MIIFSVFRRTTKQVWTLLSYESRFFDFQNTLICNLCEKINPKNCWSFKTQNPLKWNFEGLIYKLACFVFLVSFPLFITWSENLTTSWKIVQTVFRFFNYCFQLIENPWKKLYIFLLDLSEKIRAPPPPSPRFISNSGFVAKLNRCAALIRRTCM